MHPENEGVMTAAAARKIRFRRDTVWHLPIPDLPGYLFWGL